MGQIDVADLLADPDFVEPMQIIRRNTTVDNYGQNQITESGFQTYGSIQPASGKTLNRLPEALRDVNLMSFWVKGEIVTDAKGRYTDVLVFQGSRFQVKTVLDWTNWGQGWCEGLCIREKPSR